MEAAEIIEDSPPEQQPAPKASKPRLKGGKKRIVFEFSEAAYKQLQELREKSDAGSNVAVIKDALRLYDLVREHVSKGWALQLVKDDKAKELVL